MAKARGPMTKTAARKLLREAGEAGMDWIGLRDCRFVFGPLADALRAIDRPDALPRDLRLAGNEKVRSGSRGRRSSRA